MCTEGVPGTSRGHCFAVSPYMGWQPPSRGQSRPASSALATAPSGRKSPLCVGPVPRRRSAEGSWGRTLHDRALQGSLQVKGGLVLRPQCSGRLPPMPQHPGALRNTAREADKTGNRPTRPMNPSPQTCSRLRFARWRWGRGWLGALGTPNPHATMSWFPHCDPQDPPPFHRTAPPANVLGRPGSPSAPPGLQLPVCGSRGRRGEAARAELLSPSRLPKAVQTTKHRAQGSEHPEPRAPGKCSNLPEEWRLSCPGNRVSVQKKRKGEKASQCSVSGHQLPGQGDRGEGPRGTAVTHSLEAARRVASSGRSPRHRGHTSPWSPPPTLRPGAGGLALTWVTAVTTPLPEGGLVLPSLPVCL